MHKIITRAALAIVAVVAFAGCADASVDTGNSSGCTWAAGDSVPLGKGHYVCADSAPSVAPKPDKYAPSAAWQHAGPEQRAEAFTAMVDMVGAEQTCARDIAHSYKGLYLDKKGDHDDLPSKQHPGQHHEFSEYADGVCDGPGADKGL